MNQNVTETDIDDKVDEWHEGTSPLTLSEFLMTELGLTKNEVELYVINPTALFSQ